VVKEKVAYVCYCMNIVSKIISLITPNSINLGENAYELLDKKCKVVFRCYQSHGTIGNMLIWNLISLIKSIILFL